MAPSRVRGTSALLAVGLLLAGCGGGGHKTTRSASPSAARPSASPSPTPSYAPQHVAAALLSAGDIDPKVKKQTPGIPPLKQHAVPSCELSAIKPSGGPAVAVRQFDAGPYTGAHFGQVALTYPDAAAAAAMFATVRSKTAACPAKRHVPPKTLPNGIILLSHDETWRTSEVSTSGWFHVRGFEKSVDPPRSSIINVYYRVYDYVSRGNLVLVSMYWERVGPKASGDAIAAKATALLAKQLGRLS